MKTWKQLKLTTIIAIFLIAITVLFWTACDGENGNNDPECSECGEETANCTCNQNNICGECGQPEAECTCNQEEPCDVCGNEECTCVPEWSEKIGNINVSKVDGVSEEAADEFVAVIEGALDELDGTGGITKIIIGEGAGISRDGNTVTIGINATADAIKLYFIDNILEPNTYSIRGIPVNFTGGIKNSEMDAEFDLLDDGIDELDEDELIKKHISKITIGGENGCVKVGDKWEITLARGQSGADIAELLKGYLDNQIDPLCKDTCYIDCGKRGCEVIAIGQVNFGAESFDIFQHPDVSEEAMATAIANIEAGYNGLGDGDRAVLNGKIGEIRIVPATGANSSVSSGDGKRILTFRAGQTSDQIQGGFEFWIGRDDFAMMTPSLKNTTHETIRMAEAPVDSKVTASQVAFNAVGEARNKLLTDVASEKLVLTV